MPRSKVSLRQLAKACGVTVQALSGAVADGRLSAGIARDAKGRVRVVDPDALLAEWRALHAPRPSPAELASVGDDAVVFAEVRRRREVEQLRLSRVRREAAELELAVQRGELVPAAGIRDAWVKAVTAARTRLLGVPAQLRAARPDIGAADLRRIDELIHEALEALADGRSEPR